MKKDDGLVFWYRRELKWARACLCACVRATVDLASWSWAGSDYVVLRMGAWVVDPNGSSPRPGTARVSTVQASPAAAALSALRVNLLEAHSHVTIG